MSKRITGNSTKLKHKASATNRFNAKRTARANVKTPRRAGYSGLAEDPVRVPTGKGKRGGDAYSREVNQAGHIISGGPSDKAKKGAAR